MSTPPPLPPPDWYADPADAVQQRWWSGQSWTDHVRPLVAPPPVQQWSAPTSAMPTYVPMGGAYGSQYSGPYGTQVRPQDISPNTVPVWLLAVYPAIAFVVALVRAALPEGASTALTFPLLIVAAAFLFGMVFWDHYELTRRGLAAASPAWGLLGVIGYLIARRVVLKRSGVIHDAPGNVFGGLVLLYIVAAIALALVVAATYR